MKENILYALTIAAAIASVVATGGLTLKLGRNEAMAGKIGIPQELDQDGDGKLSSEEFPESDERFTQLDTNADGYIDASEFLPPSPGQRPQAENLIERFDTDGDGQLSTDEFKGPEELFKRLDTDGDGILSARELSREPHGKGFKDDDSDGDGKVSRSEFHGPEDLFDKLDADGDGYITESEAAQGRPRNRPSQAAPKQ